MTPNSPVVVVGGGMAGLAAAYELHRQGRAFVLLEASSRAGGVVLSEQVDGYIIDGGPDALLAQKPEGIRLCEELGLGPRLVPTNPPRLAFIQRGGQLFPLPAASVLGIPTAWGPFLKTRLFSWAGKARMGAELFVPPRRDGADESIGAFMTRRFGAEAATYLAEPLLAGIHAGDVNRLSVGALFPRFVESEAKYGSLLRAFRREQRAPSPDGAFRSLPGGLSELVEALVGVLPRASVRLRTPVCRVRRTAAGFAVDTATGESLTTTTVVMATPAFVTATIVRELAPELAQLCNGIAYTSVATVALAFKREQLAHPLNGSGFVVPEVEKTGIMAGSWLSSKWPNRAPAGRALLRTFLGGSRDPGAIERDDAALIDTSLRALTPLVGISGQPELTRVYRWPRANAQHDVGHRERVAAIDAALAKHPGLHVTGSAYRGVGIPDCVADGRAVARRIATTGSRDLRI